MTKNRQIIVLFTTGDPKLADGFFQSLEETNPDIGAYAIPPGHRTHVFNQAVSDLGPGRPDDILLFCDDDIIWKGKIEPPSEFFTSSLLPQLHHHVPGEGWMCLPAPFADGWAIGISRRLFDAVGGWDENFLYSGFQDADISLACMELGYPPTLWDFPGEHLGSGTKYVINPNHNQTRLANLQYLREKWGLPVITTRQRGTLAGLSPEEIWERVKKIA